MKELVLAFDQQKILPSAVTVEISSGSRKSAFYGLNGLILVNWISFVRVRWNLQIPLQNARKLGRRESTSLEGVDP